MKTKVCRACNRRLSISRFYPHPETADGRTNKCKNCMRQEQRKRDRARRRRLLKGVEAGEKAQRHSFSNTTHSEYDPRGYAVRDTGRRTELAAMWAFPGIEGDFLTAG